MCPGGGVRRDDVVYPLAWTNLFGRRRLLRGHRHRARDRVYRLRYVCSGVLACVREQFGLFNRVLPPARQWRTRVCAGVPLRSERDVHRRDGSPLRGRHRLLPRSRNGSRHGVHQRRRRTRVFTCLHRRHGLHHGMLRHA